MYNIKLHNYTTHHPIKSSHSSSDHHRITGHPYPGDLRPGRMSARKPARRPWIRPRVSSAVSSRTEASTKVAGKSTTCR